MPTGLLQEQHSSVHSFLHSRAVTACPPCPGHFPRCWSSRAPSRGAHHLVGHEQTDKRKPWDIRDEAFHAGEWEAFRANFLEEVAP